MRLDRNWRTRLQERRKAPPHMGLWFQAVILGIYISLIYKLVVPGIALMVIASMGLLGMYRVSWRLSPVEAALSIAYAALATITAFLVSIDEGIARTAQFLLVTVSAIAITKYLTIIDHDAREKAFKRFCLVNILVLFHIIVYHLSIGRFETWKYLYDTKFVFSLLVVLLFTLESSIKRWSMTAWGSSFALLFAAILLSGERKAYLLLALVFVMSRARLSIKIAVAAGGAFMVLALASLAPQSYITRQIGGQEQDPKTLSNRYFFSDTSLIDNSDYIRAFVNRNARSIFTDNPIFGIGATGYEHMARQRYGSLAQSHGLSMNVHGEPNRVPVENGLIGVVVVILFIFSSTVKVVRYTMIRHGANASALSRLPLYTLTMMISYIYGEAMDTTMLFIILLTGFLAASLKFPDQSIMILGSRKQRLTRISA